MKGKIYVLCGKSASGKDTLLKAVLSTGGTNKSIGLLPSITTRPMRPGEKDGIEYKFVSDAIYDKMMLEGDISCAYVAGNGWRYGKICPSDIVYDDLITIGNISAIKELRAIYGSENVVAIYLDASEKCRKSRALMRCGWEMFDEDEWTRREKDDKSAFSAKLVNKYCKFILNTEGATPTQLYNKFKCIYLLLKGGVKVL